VSDACTSTEVPGRTRMPHLQQQREQAAFEDERPLTTSSTVEQIPQVTVMGSQTGVGSLQ
jgi:hypothetical protein